MTSKRMLTRWLVVVTVLGGSFMLTPAQSPVRDYRRAHERQILDEFTHLLAIPNVASDHENIRKNAELILEMMKQRVLNSQLLEAKSKDTPPAVYGVFNVSRATQSIVLYA